MAPNSAAYAPIAGKETGPELTFNEMFLILVVFGHICVFYIVIWWLETSSVAEESSDPHQREDNLESQYIKLETIPASSGTGAISTGMRV
ncbi:uncharacterized protein N7498_003443 [Penicillium cinerascens]|uniref:Uncharacterized protein n=1 Tax=Penicillium cinerascens TaxID=70096 RepID=A0A9W9N258_9EURO|nr:uncharacterized protein N7498_003443 [Penicillium cinerascens]KAJ5211797.1 hypothetical protein N7498_003443 [Penicillium cinerascens]